MSMIFLIKLQFIPHSFQQTFKTNLNGVKGVYAIITYPLSILKLLVSNTLWFLASYKQSVIQLHVTCIGN